MRMFNRKKTVDISKASAHLANKIAQDQISEKVEAIETLCNSYDDNVEYKRSTRDTQAEALSDECKENSTFKNALYNPDRKIGTSEDITYRFKIIEDHGDASEGIRVLRGLDVMNTIINYPNLLATKGGVEVDTGSDKTNEIVKNKLIEFNYKKILYDLIKYTKISSYGACLIVQTQDPTNANVVWSDSEELTGFNVIPDYGFFYINSIGLDEVWSTRYNRPRDFWVGGVRPDESRFIHSILEYDAYSGRGENILQKNLQAVMGLNITEISFTHLLVGAHLKILKYPVDATLHGGAADNYEKLILERAGRVRNEASGQSYITMPNDMDIQFREMTAPDGLRGITEFLVNFLAMSSLTPEVILRGSSAGEIASAEKNMRQFYEVLQSREQEQIMRPAIKFMVDKIIPDTEYEIEFPPIKELDEMETIDLDIKKLELEAMRRDNEALEDSVDSKEIA